MITSAFRHLSQIGTVLLTLSVAVPSPEANAQSFPSRPIRFVVPTSASTPPDMISLPLLAAPALLPNLGFHLETDLAPVIKVSVSYNVLVVNPSVPANSVSELVSLLKSRPDQFTFSSGGFGTPAHLIGEMFKLQTGVRATHVPYQQFPQAIADLLNGTNHYMFITMLPVVD